MSDQPAVEREIPRISYPEDLPIAQHREDIAAALAEHQLVIVAGETGSGKTTQLPKICLDLGRGRVQRIGHTQPRRLAARTIATRIAEELGQTVGELVGYQVRFQELANQNTAIKLMTDGILLSEMQRDRDLSQYDTLIIDEAHERSLNIDFILGYIKRLLPRRPDLKVVITSATIDVERFSAFFDEAPIIEVSGRSYPVETHYLGRESSANEDLMRQISDTVKAVQAAQYGPPGDMLVFLPGERDIRDVARRLRGTDGLDVLPLYARLSQAEQARVFGRGSRRGLRVVLATNVAETSVTVPGIRFVIDPGEARISRYPYRTRVQRLPIEAISQASADQRKGRCGRVGPGVCLRLYSEEDFLNRPAFTDPEIKRSNLAAVILQMLHLGLGDVQKFPFIEPPDPRLVRDGFRLLEELGAVSANLRMSRLGRRMASFPIDPSLSRMVLAAQQRGALAELLVIASALSIQDPRDRPADKQSQADQAHARHRDPRSDFLSLLNLWRFYEEQRQELTENQLRKLCKREYLSWLRMREWRDIHRQLAVACRSQGLRPKLELSAEVDYEGVHRALLAGLLGGIAQQEERREYNGTRNRKLQLFPGSALYKKPPKWIVAGEIVETQKVYARSAAAIEPHWVLDINPSLLKHHHYEPRWQKEKGRVVAWQRSSLFGLTVSDRVSVNFAKVDPVASREILIREGLITGKWQRPPGFLKHNLRLRKEVEDLESRLRRRDLLVDEEALFRFYADRLPANITNAATLAAWVKEHGDASLRMDRSQLLTRDPGRLTEQFPDRLEHEEQSYRLSYQFSPGKEADGVSITVPVALMNRLPRFRLEWLVPGLLREKCIALFKGLPKTLRKQLVPVPDWVDRVLTEISPADEPLTDALSRGLARLGGPKISPGDWGGVDIDDYYRMNLRVVDAKGRLLKQGRDITALIEHYADETRLQLSASGADTPARDNITQWDFGELVSEHRFRQAGLEITAYPALEDHGDSVGITLLDYPAEAWRVQRQGLARLLMLANKPLFRDLRKRMFRTNALALILATLELSREQLVEPLLIAICLEAAGMLHGDCRDKAAFDEARQRVAREGVRTANHYEQNLSHALETIAGSVRYMQRYGETYGEARQDLKAQRRWLLSDTMLQNCSQELIGHYSRYAKAMAVRAERLAANYRRDQENQALVDQLQSPMQELLTALPGAMTSSHSLRSYTVMLEELRVSLFAQHLGTSRPVSEKRLRAQWSTVSEWQKTTLGRQLE
ncbi:MAG: ATP-dependent RNA helicase HrpA [Congregibacter sp.]